MLYPKIQLLFSSSLRCDSDLTWNSAAGTCSKEVQISASQQWQVGYKLPQGKVARITASGKWRIVPPYSTGPGGSGSGAFPTAVLDDAPLGCLVVRDGDGNYFPFKKDDQEVVVTTPGDISFVANDEFGSIEGKGFADNNGSLSVKISITDR